MRIITAAVPEPSAFLLLAMAGMGVLVKRGSRAALISH